MQLLEPAVAKIIGDLDRASRHVVNLRGVFADRRINQALDEIARIAREYPCLVLPDPFQDGWEWFISSQISTEIGNKWQVKMAWECM